MRSLNKATIPTAQSRTRKPNLTVVPPPTPPATRKPKAQVLLDAAAQHYMAAGLTSQGWTLTPPTTLTEGWIPERTLTAHVPTTATATKTITAISHHGRALLAIVDFDRANPGHGLTRAETQHLASLETNGVTGSPWHRVGDLVPFGLLTVKHDITGTPMKRRNPSSNRPAEILILTPKGRAVARTLRRRLNAGKGHLPVLLNPAPKPTPATKTTPKRPTLVPAPGAGVLATSADYRAGQKKPRKR